MKKKEYEKAVFVEGKTAEEMNEAYNKAVEEVGEYSPESELFYMDGAYRAIIRFKVMEREPENLADKYELEGKSLICGDCPFFSLSQDRRIKYSFCDKGKRVSYSEKACEYLYEQIEKGLVVL